MNHCTIVITLLPPLSADTSPSDTMADPSMMLRCQYFSKPDYQLNPLTGLRTAYTENLNPSVVNSMTLPSSVNRKEPNENIPTMMLSGNETTTDHSMLIRDRQKRHIDLNQRNSINYKVTEDYVRQTDSIAEVNLLPTMTSACNTLPVRRSSCTRGQPSDLSVDSLPGRTSHYNARDKNLKGAKHAISSSEEKQRESVV